VLNEVSECFAIVTYCVFTEIFFLTCCPLIFHEVGAHAGLEQTPNYPKYASRVAQLAESGNKDALEAIKRATGQEKYLGKDTVRNDSETLAYFIQHMAEKEQPHEAVKPHVLSDTL